MLSHLFIFTTENETQLEENPLLTTIAKMVGGSDHLVVYKIIEFDVVVGRIM